MSFGFETLIDLKNCESDIKDADLIKQYVDELVELIDMKKYGECEIVDFGEDEKVAGYSMKQFIETSLISGHFVNATNAAYINIFSCKPYNAQAASEFTNKFFKAEKMNYQMIIRG